MKMPKRTKEIELDGDYKGFKCVIITSIPMQAFSFIQSANFNLIQAALKQILVSWNFNDSDGNPLPQPGEMVPTFDIFGKEMTEEKPIYKNGKDTGETKPVSVKISAISLIPQDLAMKIIEAAMRAISDVPTP